jgi:D-glycero-D-manno-heptose 1,7-bisphosphate phosphatase
LSTEPFILFLDRDGTIILDRGYGVVPDEVELVSGAAEALATVVQLGARLCVVTNQSAIGRRLTDRSTVDAVNERVLELLRDDDVEVECVLICPHTPDDGCSCRKPSSELLEQGASILELPLTGSFMIGDNESDVLAGRGAGATTVLISSSKDNESAADRVAISLVEAIDYVADTVQS